MTAAVPADHSCGSAGMVGMGVYGRHIVVSSGEHTLGVAVDIVVK
jgi:hypothetical protein